MKVFEFEIEKNAKLYSQFKGTCAQNNNQNFEFGF